MNNISEIRFRFTQLQDAMTAAMIGCDNAEAKVLLRAIEETQKTRRLFYEAPFAGIAESGQDAASQQLRANTP